MITIHVLGFGELFQQLLNAVAAFMKQEGFSSLLRMTALVGIIMASVGYLKERNPMIYAKWVLGYVLILQLVITPKTSVDIYDISAQDTRVVDNVPVVFAIAASLITTVGVGLAESYDALLSLPDDLTYTKTGSLFGSKMIQASRDFRIMDPQLKSEMSEYLRNCVVGDIRLNHKYSVSDLSTTQHIWNLISKTPSPLRMVEINGERVSCAEAAKPEGDYSLRAKLNIEIKNAYTFFGVNLFSRERVTNYESLFETHLTSAFNYYQLMTDESANIVLQSMMINAMGDGIKDYQAFTDSTAGIVNNQVTKSQVQHRWAWAIAGQKAAWFLPILHTLLSVLLFGIFPIIMAMSTLPNGVKIFRGYLQFFISLQFWPVLFAILNAAMTLYAKNKTVALGGLSLVNIDKIDELHSDISGVAGYLMLMIPFLAKGLVSNLSDAFNNLATSMSSHLQGSAMSVAQDAASASFSLGQTSFYNTSANNFSANKHDNNWTHMHGMRTEQLATGVVKTHTASGTTVFDVSPGMTKGHVHVADSKALTASLDKAYESSLQGAKSESQNYQTALSNFMGLASQFSSLKGYDLRVGDGLSETQTGHINQAFQTMNHIAEDIAKRLHISKEAAFTHMASIGTDAHAGVRLPFVGGVSAHAKVGHGASSAKRQSDGLDNAISAREAADFHQAYQYAHQFIQNHHVDEASTQGEHLVNQMAVDLKRATNASQQYDAHLSRAHRISDAKRTVEMDGITINTDLNQAFESFVSHKIGSKARDALFSHPGNPEAIETLQALGHEFIEAKREALIARVDHLENKPEQFYQNESHQVNAFAKGIVGQYEREKKNLLNQENVTKVQNQVLEKDPVVTKAIHKIKEKTEQGDAKITEETTKLQTTINNKIKA